MQSQSLIQSLPHSLTHSLTYGQADVSQVRVLVVQEALLALQRLLAGGLHAPCWAALHFSPLRGLN